MASEPAIIPSAWAANNTATEEIPATTSESGKASWDQGFPIETSLPLSQGGIPPRYGDFNGILRALSEFALFAQAGGTFAWRSTLDYAVGSIVVGTDGSLYRAAAASGPSSTAVNPVGDTSGKWERITSQSDLTALSTAVAGAVSDAATAVSTAGAAQSAVTTLDANVVKTSGNQTVGGTKQFTGSIQVDTSISRSNTNGALYLVGGTAANDANQGAKIGLRGASTGGSWFIQARDTINDSVVSKQLNGSADGSLTWDGKDIILNGGDQTIGGAKTFTGTITVKSGAAGVVAPDASSYVQICGGANNYNSQGATLAAYGAENSGAPGEFYLKAANSSSSKLLNGKPDGTLTWDSKGFVFDTGTQNVQGKKTFLSGIASGITAALTRDVNDSYIILYGGTAWGNGAHLQLYGKDSASTPGAFTVRASNGSTSKDLSGLTDGTLKWNGQPVQTSSDERLKMAIGAVPDDVLDAWGAVQWTQFKFKDAAERKGEENCRWHAGLIAQHVQQAMQAQDVDALRYGILCHEEWQEETDEDGEVTRKAGDQWMVRYEEALAMEAAYQRRRADRAEARIASLEERLAALEAFLLEAAGTASEAEIAAAEDIDGE